MLKNKYPSVRSLLVCLAQSSLLFGAATAYAVSSPGNSFGDNVQCTSSPCYDFTVYDYSSAFGVPGPQSLGYIEGFVGYSNPNGNGISSGANLVLQRLYFVTISNPTNATNDGIATPGATTNAWAPVVTNGYFDTDYGTPALKVTSGIYSGTSQGQFRTGTAIDWNVGNTYYQLQFNNGSAYIAYNIGTPISGSYAYSISLPQLAYGSTTTKNGETLGTSTPFGGQIAPEMDAKSALNVLMLLVSLMLVFRNKLGFKRQLASVSA